MRIDLGALLSLEEAFWKGDAEFYRANLTDDAEMVMPAPAGVLRKEETMAAIASAPRWAAVRLFDAHVLRLTDTAVLLIYRATAERPGDARPYSALATSAYVFRDGSWKLACHQQTPSER